MLSKLTFGEGLSRQMDYPRLAIKYLRDPPTLVPDVAGDRACLHLSQGGELLIGGTSSFIRRPERRRERCFVGG